MENAISFENGQFVVSSLESFKGLELDAGKYLVRKIEKGTGLESKGVIIPAVKDEEFVLALENAAIFSELKDAYQGLIEEVCKVKIAAGTGTILASDFSLSELEKFLSEKNIKQGRISKDTIKAWFDSKVAGVLKRAFIEKLGEVDNDRMLGILQGYQAQFMNLAKRDLTIPEAVKGNLKKALELIGDDDSMKAYCLGKLNSAQNKGIDMEAL